MEPRWWTEIGSPWQACLELAWESFGNGSIPVGAVVVDPDGLIVARGRNRQREESAPSPQVAGTSLAHAEINALVQMRRGDYSSHCLYSTLQPCLLCTGAICHTRIGTVHYAAADPLLAGIDRLPEINAHIARRWPRWNGQPESPVALWSQLFTFVFAVRDDTTVLSGMARRSPDLHERAAAISDLAVLLDSFADAPFRELLLDAKAVQLRDLYAALVRDWWPKP